MLSKIHARVYFGLLQRFRCFIISALLRGRHMHGLRSFTPLIVYLVLCVSFQQVGGCARPSTRGRIECMSSYSCAWQKECQDGQSVFLDVRFRKWKTGTEINVRCYILAVLCMPTLLNFLHNSLIYCTIWNIKAFGTCPTPERFSFMSLGESIIVIHVAFLLHWGGTQGGCFSYINVYSWGYLKKKK